MGRHIRDEAGYTSADGESRGIDRAAHLVPDMSPPSAAMPERTRAATRLWVVASVLVAGLQFGPGAWAQGAPASTDSRSGVFTGRAAWQIDEKLGRKWQEITGQFIFQRTCLPCHVRGPASFSREEWRERLVEFPDEGHTALLPEEFGDLTAMFAYGSMVPDDRSRYRSLEAFLVENAPPEVAEIDDAIGNAVDLLPAVGQRAPDFSIVDADDNRRNLASYVENKTALILVFSRAHW